MSGASEIRPDRELVLLHGEDRAGILSTARSVRRRIAGESTLELGTLAAELHGSGTPARAPLAIVAGSVADLDMKLAHALERLADPQCVRLRERTGVYFFEQPLAAAGSVAFLFPGEGAQYRGMLADLCLRLDEARRWLDLAERTCLERDRTPALGDLLYGDPHADEEALWSTDLGAAAVFSANQALLEVLRRLRIQPAMAVGHSTGDYSALFAAGALDLPDHDVVDACCTLGEIHARAQAGGRILDYGLLAVAAPKLEALIASVLSDEIFLALDNCPHQVVIAMAASRVESIARELSARGAVCGALPYGRGYHTPAFAGFADMLAPFVAALPLRRPRIALWSCATAAPYPDDLGAFRDLLVGQWTRPVRFRDTVTAMYDTGARVFVEVGPRGNLTGFVSDILKRRPHVALASNLQSRGAVEQIAHLAGMLAAHGVPVELEWLFPSGGGRRPDRREGTGHRVAVAIPALGLPAPISTAPPAPARKPAGPADPPPRRAAGEGAATVLEEYLRATESLISAQERTMRAYLARHSAGPVAVATGTPPAPASLLGEVLACEPGMRIVAERTLSIHEDSFLRDHTLGREVSRTDPDLTALPVVPLTVSVDLLAQAAAALAPGLRPIAVRTVRARRWIALEQDSTVLRICAERLDGDAVAASIALLDDERREAVVVDATVELARHYPTAPTPSLPPLGDPRPSRWDAAALYEEGMFHGPAFQGVASIGAWSPEGIDATLRTLPADVLGPGGSRVAVLAEPILLDAAGQLVGFWAAEQAPLDVFPVAVERIELFGATLPPGRAVSARARVRHADGMTVRSDLEIVDGDRVHARVTGWQNRCFRPPAELFALRVGPRTAALGREVAVPAPHRTAPGAVCCRAVEAFTGAVLDAGGGIWRTALARLLLSRAERREWEALRSHPRRADAWLRGRAAAKDAVRALHATERVRPAPADVVIATTESGRPVVVPEPAVSLSIAHAGEVGVALAAVGVKGAGVDVEPSGALPVDAVGVAFDAAELELLGTGGDGGWLTRGWCAKESAGKALSLGLGDGPAALKVIAADRASGVVTVRPEGPVRPGRAMTVATSDDGVMVIATCLLYDRQEDA